MKSILLLSLAAGVTLVTGRAADSPLYGIPLRDIDGKPTTLKVYQGKVLLIVNVASKCGYTRQYKPLEATYQKYKDRGLVILGFPSNDFGAQEPGTPDEIKQFCTGTYNVTFPLFDKVQVKGGSGQHPLYAALTGRESPFPGAVKWNFGKFLVGRDGRILARFDSAEEPDSEKVTRALEAALGTR